MRAGDPDKFRASAFSFSLLLRHFPANWEITSLFVGFFSSIVYLCILKNMITITPPKLMKKLLFILALMLVAFTVNAQSNLNGDMNHDGEKNITDVILLVDEILNGAGSKSYLTCPDNHHPHLIDLGLPSGTKWACCNVGATAPEDYGGYYA